MDFLIGFSAAVVLGLISGLWSLNSSEHEARFDPVITTCSVTILLEGIGLGWISSTSYRFCWAIIGAIVLSWIFLITIALVATALEDSSQDQLYKGEVNAPRVRPTYYFWT
jgi:hypothetical protein